jgi:hypothetical protein
MLTRSSREASPRFVLRSPRLKSPHFKQTSPRPARKAIVQIQRQNSPFDKNSSPQSQKSVAVGAAITMWWARPFEAERTPLDNLSSATRAMFASERKVLHVPPPRKEHKTQHEVPTLHPGSKRQATWQSGSGLFQAPDVDAAASLSQCTTPVKEELSDIVIQKDLALCTQNLKLEIPSAQSQTEQQPTRSSLTPVTEDTDTVEGPCVSVDHRARQVESITTVHGQAGQLREAVHAARCDPRLRPSPPLTITNPTAGDPVCHTTESTTVACNDESAKGVRKSDLLERASNIDTEEGLDPGEARTRDVREVQRWAADRQEERRRKQEEERMSLRQERKEAERREREKENEERKERQRQRESELQLLRAPRSTTLQYTLHTESPDHHLRGYEASRASPLVKREGQAQVVSTSPSPAIQAGLTRRGAGAARRSSPGALVTHGTAPFTAAAPAPRRPPAAPPSRPPDFDSASVAEQARAAREALTAADTEARPEKLTDLDAAKVREQVRAARAALSRSSPPPQKTAFDATSVAQQARDAKAELGKMLARDEGEKRWGGESKMVPQPQSPQHRRRGEHLHPQGLAQALQLEPVSVEQLFAVPCAAPTPAVTTATAARTGARARLAPAGRQEWEIKSLSREEEARAYGAHACALAPESAAAAACLSAPEGSSTVKPVPYLCSPQLPLYVLGNLPVVAEGREDDVEVADGQGYRVASCEVLFEPDDERAASPAESAEDLTFEEFYSQVTRFQPT